MGFFKGLRQFGTGVVEGVNQQLPGLIEGQRRSAELQNQRDFQMDLQGQQQDFTAEQALLERITRIETVNEAQTLLGSAFVAGNSGAKAALQGRIDAIGRERELEKEFRTETDERQRELATFTQGLANTAQQAREKREAERLKASQDRSNVHNTVRAIMMNKGMLSLDARYELAKDAADGHPGLLKSLNLLQSQKIEYMDKPNRVTELDAFDIAKQLMGEEKWNASNATERFGAYADVLVLHGIDSPAAARGKATANKVTAKVIKDGEPITKTEFVNRWTIAASMGGPGYDNTARDAALAKLTAAKLIIGRGEEGPQISAPATPAGQAGQAVGAGARKAWQWMNKPIGEPGPSIASQFAAGLMTPPEDNTGVVR